jgi:hypothetical protein
MMLLLSFLACAAFAIPIYNFQNIQHFGEIQVGGQELVVIFDTGSTHQWITSTECKSIVCKSNKRYSPQKSSTIQPMSQKFEVWYGSGLIKGVMALEEVLIGDFKLKDFPIGLVYEEIGDSFREVIMYSASILWNHRTGNQRRRK